MSANESAPSSLSAAAADIELRTRESEISQLARSREVCCETLIEVTPNVCHRGTPPTTPASEDSASLRSEINRELRPGAPAQQAPAQIASDSADYGRCSRTYTDPGSMPGTVGIAPLTKAAFAAKVSDHDFASRLSRTTTDTDSYAISRSLLVSNDNFALGAFSIEAPGAWAAGPHERQATHSWEKYFDRGLNLVETEVTAQDWLDEMDARLFRAGATVGGDEKRNFR